MDQSSESTITHRQIDTDLQESGAKIAEIVAELEGKPATDLTSMWGCTDDVLAHIFSDPPSPEAEMVVEFTYEGYRITVEQDGTTELFEVE